MSIIDVANAAGYDTVWISNQVQYGLADTPITTIASEAKQQIWLHDKVWTFKRWQISLICQIIMMKN